MNQILSYIVKLAGFFYFLTVFTGRAGAQEISEKENLMSEVRSIMGKYEYLAEIPESWFTTISVRMRVSGRYP